MLRGATARARLPWPPSLRVRPIRRANAADVSARISDARRFRRAALPAQIPVAARSLATAGRVGVESAAPGANSPKRRGGTRGRVAGDRDDDDAADPIDAG